MSVLSILSSDGVLGLTRGILSQQGVPTVVEVLRAQNMIDQAIVGYKIPRLADQKNDGGVTFGAADLSKFQSSTLVTMPNVDPQGFWAAAIDSIEVNNQVLISQNRTASMDTGTSYIVAPEAVSQTYVRRRSITYMVISRMLLQLIRVYLALSLLARVYTKYHATLPQLCLSHSLVRSVRPSIMLRFSC